MSETSKAYGPHPRARAHAHVAWTKTIEAGYPGDVAVDDAINALHDPAQGLDGSTCKRAVIERIQREADEYDDEGDQILVRRVAETLVREWHRVR